jgi:hypothetical protein
MGAGDCKLSYYKINAEDCKAFYKEACFSAFFYSFIFTDAIVRGPVHGL